jgi:enoyl-CoA hydratase/carnithine racemase
MTSPQPVEIPPPSLDDVLFEKKDGFAVITLNRPVVLNAVNWSILRRLEAALDRAEAAEDVHAIILTGAGRAFCAGGDIQSSPPDDDLPTPNGRDLYMRLWNMPVPVIAAVRGYAVGQGCELAAICDLTIASEDAVFGELQIRHGFGPPVLIAPYAVGLKQAKEMLLLGERIPAADALRMGLINRIVPGERLMDEAEAIARKLAALPAKAVRGNKILVNRVYELAGFLQGLDYRDDAAWAATQAADNQDQLNAHLKVLREQGWEAFRDSRDRLYQGDR